MKGRILEYTEIDELGDSIITLEADLEYKKEILQHYGSEIYEGERELKKMKQALATLETGAVFPIEGQLEIEDRGA